MKWLFGKRKKSVQPLTKEQCAGRLFHIAFIMDGNGRFAQMQGMQRTYGHQKGAETMKRIVRRCADLGIGTCTLYAFSTENWSRPKEEVDAIMQILYRYVEDATAMLDREDVRYVFLGDKSRLPKDLAEGAAHLEEASKDKRLVLNIALNYGGRAELVHAFQTMLDEGVQTVTEEQISAHLYTKCSPDPDLVVRTGGDFRISNFLLWQSAYAELFFTKTLWPELSEEELDDIIRAYLSRQRRYGGVIEEK